jgi:hypothetical protein
MSEKTSSQILEQVIGAFSSNNPDFSLAGTNLYKRSKLNSLNWDGLDQQEAIKKLKMYQRLMKLSDDKFVIQSLVDNGFESAHHIAAMTEDSFAANYASALNISEETSRGIYKKAEAIKAKTMFLWANVKDVVASPYYKSMKVNNISSNITEFFESIPSYQELFGSLDYYEVDEAKSIFGPAAYFVDLMRIVNEYIAEGNQIPLNHTLDARRPDLKKILLTKENTEQTVPYLQIVNEVLVNIVKNYPAVGDSESKEQDAIEVFKSFVTSKYPFNLPFNLPLEKIRTYLGQLNINLSDIFEIFDMTKSPTIEFSREFLKLSMEEYEVITTPLADGISLGESFGFPQGLITGDDGIESFLSKTKLNLMEVFKQKTGVDEAKVEELFKLNLSEDELNTPEILAQSFINKGSGPTGNTMIVIKKDAEKNEHKEIINLDFNKLDRINRVIRLAQKLNWSFVDLDWVFTSLGVNEIDNVVIINLSIIKKLSDQYKISLISLCNLWYDIKTIGEGNNSQVPFDLIFNDINIVKSRKDKLIYHPKTSGNSSPEDNTSYNNPLYLDDLYELDITQNESENLPEQALAKSIVTSSIPAKGNDFYAICGFLFEGKNKINLSIPNLSALYRHATFAKYLGIRIPEYIVILSLLGKKGKKVLSLEDTLEIFQTAEWMKKSKFNGYDLDFIISGIQNPYVSKQFTDQKVNQFISSLPLSMKPVYVNEKFFVSPEIGIDENESSEIFKRLVKYDLVSASGIILLEDFNYLSFKSWYKYQYEQIFEAESNQQVKWVLNKLANKKSEQEEKLAMQLAIFFGAKEELMSAVIKLGKIILIEYGSNWIKMFDDNVSVVTAEGSTPDIIKKIMNVISRYIILAQKLNLKGGELESIALNYTSYNISSLKELTLDNIKSLYEYKQLSLKLGEEITSYFEGVNNASSADDITSYINKQFDYDKVSMFLMSLSDLMKPLYVEAKFFVSDENGIDEDISEELFNMLVEDGFIDNSGVIILEQIDFSEFKIQYEVQYTKLLDIIQETKVEFVFNNMMSLRSKQESMILEELSVFLNIDFELMSVLSNIASKALIEHIRNYAEFFMKNIPEAIGSVSIAIKKFMMISSLYLVITRKLSLNAAQLEELFLNNGVKDIETLRSLIPNEENKLTLGVFIGIINRLKNNANPYEGSFAMIKGQIITKRILQNLNAITGWDITQIKDLCNFFFNTDICLTAAHISKLKECFDMSDSMNVNIYFLKDLYGLKDIPFSITNWDVYNSYANKILDAVKIRYSDKSWEGVYADLNSSTELKKRDKLVTTALWKVNQTYSDITSSTSLYKYLLLDVDMGAESQISYIKQGLNSIQLYLHRCRMSLEKGVTTTNIPEAWWKWVMSYRTWEANRKVFLYPENYLDPALRDSKTSLFKSLEETLMQSDITKESVEAAFTTYLDEFSKLAKLRYVDSYYATVNYPETGEKDTLFLFAQTQTTPYEYYFCSREQDGPKVKNTSAVWREWKKIDITINAEYITPVYAFNRLFIFWVERKEIKNPNNNDSTISEKATIKYSFYNFSGNWISPQILVEDKVVHFEPDEYAEKIKTSNNAEFSPFENQFDMDNIFWKKVYVMDVSEINYGSHEPEGTSKSEKFVVMYGPFLLVTSSNGKLTPISELTPKKGDDKYEYESNIYSQALNYNRIIDFSEKGYLSLNDAMIINSSLQKDFLLRSSEFLAIAMNKEKCVFKPTINKLNNSLCVAFSDSIIRDNYIGENLENTIMDTSNWQILFQSIFSSNAKIITIKNQPGMFIYDNGDETFLLAPYKKVDDNKFNLFSEIKQSYKVDLAITVFQENSFISSFIDANISSNIFEKLLSKGILDSNRFVNDAISLDSDYFLLAMILKYEPFYLSENQLIIVKEIVASHLNKVENTDFVNNDLLIDDILSNEILNVLINEGILDTTKRITTKYNKDTAIAVLSECLKKPPANLTDEQINFVNEVLLKIIYRISIDSNAFETKVGINNNLSEVIFNILTSEGILDQSGKITTKYNKDTAIALLTNCLKDNPANLTDEQIKFVNDVLLKIFNAVVISDKAFIIAVSINNNLSEEIFNIITSEGILNQSGKVTSKYNKDTARLILNGCLKKAPANLIDEQISLVNGVLLKAIDTIITDGSFIKGTQIDEFLSKEVFNILVNEGILDENGKVTDKYDKDTAIDMLNSYLKVQPVNMTDQQVSLVNEVLLKAADTTTITKSDFVLSVNIDEILSREISNALSNEDILNADRRITNKYNKDAGIAILENCLKKDPLNLMDEEINLINEVMLKAFINGDGFEVNIDYNLSIKIFHKLIELQIINESNKIADNFYDDKYLLIITTCFLLCGVFLNQWKFKIVKEILFPADNTLVQVNQESFITTINKETSKNIYNRLKNNKILDINGKFLEENFTTEKLFSSLEAPPLSLPTKNIYAVESILLKNISKVSPDSFINTDINYETSVQIFNRLKINKILYSNNSICENFNKNIDLSNILIDLTLNTSQLNSIKKVLLDLFIPVMFEYTAESENIDLNNIKFKITRISTGAVDRLSGNLFSGGIDKLLSLESQQKPKITEKNLLFERLRPTSSIDTASIDKEDSDYGYWLDDGLQVDFNGPYGNYYWELFFHAPMMIAMKLHSNQKFSDAQKWFKYIFDPTTATIGDDSGGKYPESSHWNFMPFRNYTIESLVTMLQNAGEIQAYNEDPFDPHAIARLRLGAYEKFAVIACINNLIDWGDYLFSQYTWESITEATMLYIYAYDLLGEKPRNVGAVKNQEPTDFENILVSYLKTKKDIPQFLIDLEGVLASSPDTGIPGSKRPFNEIYAYFSVPGNSQFMAYWDTVEDRLFKIRHSLNIKGEKQLLALFEPEIDPMELVRAVGADNSLFGISSYFQTVIPYYRFDYILSKAKEVTSTVIQLGSSLLSALEKNDSEAMSLLNTTHELNILNMITMQKEKQIDNQLKNIESLNENLNNAKNRYNTYKRYITEGLNVYESGSQQLKQASIISMIISEDFHGASIAGYLAPDIFGLAAGGMQFGNAIDSVANIAGAVADQLNQIASLIEISGQYVRRVDDWTLEMTSAQYDINQIEKTIEAAEIQTDIERQELAIHLKTIDQSKEIDSFLKSKFTNKDLYNWMTARISAIYFQTYKLALDVSLQAQRAYQYEIAANDTFINYGYWDSLKKGLLAGESLMYSLQQMDKAYIDNNNRGLEIEKTISLLQLNAIAFMDLKNTGKCTFNLDEELYDYDFPGHYCRRVKAISISIPAVVGPYENINAILTQTSDSVILKPDSEAVEYLLKRGQNSVSKPKTDVLRENWVMNQKVAITKGIDDAGMFVLDFNDQRYIPFEGTGAVSSWKLSMPRETNRINFDTISDVIIKVKYTALDGGESFLSEVKEKLSSAVRMYTVFKHFNLNQEFSNDWYAFINGNVVEDKQTLDFKIPNNVMITNAKNPSIKLIYLKISTPEGVIISDETGFITLTIKDTSISNMAISIRNNEGRADEEQIGNVDGFTGEWMLQFDLKKTPKELILDGALNPEILKDIEIIINYELNPFGN